MGWFVIKSIRGWRVRSEGPGFMIWFDPASEHVVLHEGGTVLAHEVREGREAGEAVARLAGSQMDCFADCEVSA